MEKLFIEFEEYCKTPGIESGKAGYYAKAIEYLCDFLGIYEIDVKAISKIKRQGNDINDKSSALYNELLLFLSARGQKSYLSKGYI